MQVLLASWLAVSGAALVFPPPWLSPFWLDVALWLGMLLAWSWAASLSARRAAAAPSVIPVAATQPPEPLLDLPVLDPLVLEELERVSPDSQFLDRLLAAFMADNLLLIDHLEESLRLGRHAETREILHGLKGAALSVGALALKAACQRGERLVSSVLPESAQQDIHAIVKAELDRLEEALIVYRRRRLERGNGKII